MSTDYKATIFLPRTDLGGQDACRTIVEAELIRAGLRDLATHWTIRPT